MSTANKGSVAKTRGFKPYTSPGHALSQADL